MKQICLIFAIGFLFFLEPGLFSQEVYSTNDSVIVYEFSSPSDSVLKRKELTSTLDSTAR